MAKRKRNENNFHPYLVSYCGETYETGNRKDTMIELWKDHKFCITVAMAAVKVVQQRRKVDFDHYNSPPKGLKEISKDDWRRGMFEYQLGPKESRQVRDSEEGIYFNLIMFAIPTFDCTKLGFAVMEDWWDHKKQKNRPKTMTRFCRYGTDEEWLIFTRRFAAQFARDNS